jgi:type I restriction enzyme S subunit
VWEGQIEGCVHQNHVFRARMRLPIDPKLVSTWGNTFGRSWFERHGRQTTNLASLNLTTLKSFPIPIPPAEEQARIVGELDRQLSEFAALEDAVVAAERRADGMRRSILTAAFEGRLVTGDRTGSMDRIEPVVGVPG